MEPRCDGDKVTPIAVASDSTDSGVLEENAGADSGFDSTSPFEPEDSGGFPATLTCGFVPYDGGPNNQTGEVCFCNLGYDGLSCTAVQAGTFCTLSMSSSYAAGPLDASAVGTIFDTACATALAHLP
jgi:hypothetical protein